MRRRTACAPRPSRWSSSSRPRTTTSPTHRRPSPGLDTLDQCGGHDPHIGSPQDGSPGLDKLDQRGGRIPDTHSRTVRKAPGRASFRGLPHSSRTWHDGFSRSDGLRTATLPLVELVETPRDDLADAPPATPVTRSRHARPTIGRDAQAGHPVSTSSTNDAGAPRRHPRTVRKAPGCATFGCLPHSSRTWHDGDSPKNGLRTATLSLVERVETP